MLQAHIVPRVRDLGDGFQVRRALPAAERRNVGPFVFFDQMGPVTIQEGRGLDVRPHPHIGLATVTYLFAGEILHRDSLGTVQSIRPGEVNWMTAGHGIVHSERTPPALRKQQSSLSGIQTWVALPREHEEIAPSFAHHGNLPMLDESGVRICLILGELFGASSPVQTLSPMFYADAAMDARTRLRLPGQYEERAVYVVDGAVECAAGTFRTGELLAFAPGGQIELAAPVAARLMLFGGAPLDGARFVWWNFVSSRRERIMEAAEAWKAGRFPKVPDETEFIPLPERGPSSVDYP